MSAAIEVVGVSKRFGPTRILDNIGLEVQDGEFVSLVGPSGCGKTTLLRIIAGLEIPTSGKVLVNDDQPSSACRLHKIGVAFQTPALVPSLTALDNVRLTLDIIGRTDCCLDPRALLERFGLGEFMRHYPHQLSGGMRQRVNIACAMVHQPAVLLLDEPFGALDEITRELMGEWLADILGASRQTVVFVTHDVEEATLLSDRVMVMSPRPGRIYSELNIRLPKPRTRRLRTSDEFVHQVLRARDALNRVIGGEQ
jgi:NitT/TauT family transport system ATP-binding protein